jgi:hypothetical protein
MPHVFVDGLPGLADSCGALSLRTPGLSAFIQCPRFIARISLESGGVKWLFERHPVPMSESAWNLPRRISISGSNLWHSDPDDIVAELLPTEDSRALVSARCAETGRRLWEYSIPIPAAANWAEQSPAWPGAPTEEIEAFFASDPTRLTVCMSRQARRSRIYSPAITVDTLPPYACQLDAIRLDASGVPVWQKSFPDVVVGIIERRSFAGIWSSGHRVGLLNFETGINRVLHEYPHALGWPVQDASLVAVPWHSNGEVGISWLDERGNQARQARWQQPRVSATYLHHTDAGLALQVNDQTLCWLGKEGIPSWNIGAKPYIYRVHCCPSTDVFIGTDGRGGRLLAFDPASGEETLNVKPPLGGAGTLAKVPAHEVLVVKFWTSRRDSVSGNLLVLSMRDRSHRMDCQCRELLGTWQHGAVCVAGKNGERLAIVDVR